MKLLWICALFGLLLLAAYSRPGNDAGAELVKSPGGRAIFATAGALPASDPEVIQTMAGDTDGPLTPSQYVLLHQTRDEDFSTLKLNGGDTLRN